MPLLPNPDVPILLVDVRGHHEFAHYGTSSVNYEEQEVVLELVKRLRRILDARVSIAVLSPYLAQTIEMKRMLRGATRGAIGINPVTHLGYNCYVRTVDSFVGRVAGEDCERTRRNLPKKTRASLLLFHVVSPAMMFFLSR